MAELSLNAKTEEIYGRRNEKGKEMQNYQDAEKQILAIQAAQQQNLRAGKINNLAQFRNTQNLIGAGNVLQQAKPQQTQQVAVNPQTQQILQKYGANKPGTVTKRMQSRQETPQHITINNNTTNTTHNQVNTAGPATQQVIRPQKDNSNEKFKLWLNNTLARQQEDYARREKDYDKRESALTRDSNKMLRKLGEFSKDMMEKMDPRNIGSTATSQIKSLLFIFGFQYLASNWVKILKTVSSIESSIKSGLTYFGLYKRNKDGSGNFCFEPGKSQLALDLKGLFTGRWEGSKLWGKNGMTGGSPFNEKKGGILGGEDGMLGGLRKVLFGNLDLGGKDKGLVEIIKDFFVNQGKKRMAAAKMVEAPDFNVGDIGASLKNFGDYLGQLLSIFLGDPEDALRRKIASKMSIDSAHRSWNKIKGLSTGDKVSVYTSTDNKEHEVEQGIRAYTRGKQKGLSLRSLDRDGELITEDAEGMYSQASDLNLAFDEAQSGDEIDTGRLATGFYRLSQAAKKTKRGRAPVPDEFVNKYLSPEEREKFIKSGDLKKSRYNYVVRKVKTTDDTGVTQQDHWYDDESITDSGWWYAGGPLKALEKGVEWGHELIDWARKENTAGDEERLVLVPEGDERGDDLITDLSEQVYEISPNVLDYIVNRYNNEDSRVNIDINDENYFKSMNNFATTTYRKYDQEKNPDKYKKTYTVDYKDTQGNKKQATLNYDEYQIWKSKKVYIGSDKEFADYANKIDYRQTLGEGDNYYNQIFQQGNIASHNPSERYDLGETIINQSLKDLDFDKLIPNLGDYSNGAKHLKQEFGSPYGTNQSILHGMSSGIIAVNPNNPEESIDFSKIDKNLSSEQLYELYNKVKDWDFNYGDEASKIVTGKNSNLKKQVVGLLKESLEAHYTGEEAAKASGTGLVSGSPGAGDIKKKFLSEVDEILSDPEVINDPDLLSKNLTTLLDKYALSDSWFANAWKNRDKIRRKDAINKSNENRVRGESEINDIIAAYSRIVSEIDDKVAMTRRETGLNALSSLIQNRQNAEGKFNEVTAKVNRYKSDPSKVTIDADDLDAEGSNQYNEYYYNMNNWKKENEARDAEFSEDVSNNAAASKVRDAVNSLTGYLSGVKETFDDYSEGVKGKLNSIFDNAKNVVNDFLRNLDYTKVSLTKWPPNTLITRDSGLLLWWAFNNGTSNTEYNFRVHDANGRFGAGRNNTPPYEVLHEGRTTFDRIHSGQDISDFVTSGGSLNNSKPTLYAPFNCKVLGYRDYNGSGDSGSGLSAGRWVLVQQTSGDSNTEKGRFKMFVCHLSKISSTVKSGKLIHKGDELGVMGGSGFVSSVKDDAGNIIKEGYWNEDKYKHHFHVNFLDTENAGPFDGPFDKPVVGTSKFYGFARSSSPSTTVGAVDPLFVFCDDKGNDISNKTLYLSSDKKVVTLDDATPGNNLKATDLADLGELNKNSEEGETSEGETGDGSDKKEEDKSILGKLWDYLKDFAMKIMTGDFGSMWDSVKEKGSEIMNKTKEIYDDFFGKYRNKSISFRQSSKTYTGKISHEFLDYQNYLNDPGKIGLGPNGELLTQAEWRDKVYDMTGSDPSALHLGELVRGYEDSNLKTAEEIGGDTEKVINAYNDIKLPDTETATTTNEVKVVDAPETYAKEGAGLSFDLGLAKQWENWNKNPVEELADNSKDQSDILREIRDGIEKQAGVITLVGETITGATDQVAKVVVATGVKPAVPQNYVQPSNTNFQNFNG